MRIALIIPEDTPPTGGNSISAHRMQAALAEAGHEAEMLLFRPQIRGFDVYHAWNATRVGSRLVEDGINPEQIVATWTGTDLWQDWVADPAGNKRRIDPIRYQVTFTEDGRTRLLQDAPDWESRLVVIPPSVDIEHFEPQGPQVKTVHPLILVAGGVRPVKRSAWAVDLVEMLREKTRRNYQLAIAGPVREEGEWRRVQERAAGKSWVHLLGNLSQDEMPAWYRACDIFLNSSEVEGVSNAIMEAMACGALVLATDIRGNRALVADERTGLLFSDEVDFLAQVQYIQEHPRQVGEMRRAARRQIVARHSRSHEAKRYERLYEDCFSIRGCCR
ncbi:MAG: glycosyl transferase family 1 [Sulfobacillus acidophilus]|uniref:Glycosyl transferase family 1 n=1 Tax=Sulfobacillus acidophilus TaxID=53633 RepID=A0A2T2WEU5_9FIRM|nr:MAG: glycosyl transferase family 1 [Sulfobacillus acidophilus]